MTEDQEFFKRMAINLVDTAVNALDEAMTYLRDLPPTADHVVALDTAQQALDHAIGAGCALR